MLVAFENTTLLFGYIVWVVLALVLLICFSLLFLRRPTFWLIHFVKRTFFLDTFYYIYFDKKNKKFQTHSHIGLDIPPMQQVIFSNEKINTDQIFYYMNTWLAKNKLDLKLVRYDPHINVDKELVYISGKITGDKNYKEKFAAAEKKLTEKGYATVNPATLGSHDDWDWEQYMKRDIEYLLKCDYIYLLEDYRESNGALLEYTIAEKLKIPELQFKIDVDRVKEVLDNIGKQNELFKEYVGGTDYEKESQYLD